MFFNCLLKSLGFFAGIVKAEIQVSCSFQKSHSGRVSHLQVLVTGVMYDRHFVANRRSSLTPVNVLQFANNSSEQCVLNLIARGRFIV